MALNNSKGNMYEFVTHTWNAIKGECPHGCTYCYMKRWGKQNPPHFDEKELKTDLGKDNFIFVGSSCDMFAKDIPEEWIIKTLHHCHKFDNKYLFQTKNPKRILDFNLPKESVICTTIESDMFYPKIMMNSPKPDERAEHMENLAYLGYKTYVTIEPIMLFNLDKMVKIINKCHPEQVNIGANTGKIQLPEPGKEQITELITELKKFTVVHEKSNLKRLLK
jgi:DNA repair photolyase